MIKHKTTSLFSRFDLDRKYAEIEKRFMKLGDQDSVSMISSKIGEKKREREETSAEEIKKPKTTSEKKWFFSLEKELAEIKRVVNMVHDARTNIVIEKERKKHQDKKHAEDDEKVKKIKEESEKQKEMFDGVFSASLFESQPDNDTKLLTKSLDFVFEVCYNTPELNKRDMVEGDDVFGHFFLEKTKPRTDYLPETTVEKTVKNEEGKEVKTVENVSEKTVIDKSKSVLSSYYLGFYFLEAKGNYKYIVDYGLFDTFLSLEFNFINIFARKAETVNDKDLAESFFEANAFMKDDQKVKELQGLSKYDIYKEVYEILSGFSSESGIKADYFEAKTQDTEFKKELFKWKSANTSYGWYVGNFLMRDCEKNYDSFFCHVAAVLTGRIKNRIEEGERYESLLEKGKLRDKRNEVIKQLEERINLGDTEVDLYTRELSESGLLKSYTDDNLKKILEADDKLNSFQWHALSIFKTFLELSASNKLNAASWTYIDSSSDKYLAAIADDVVNHLETVTNNIDNQVPPKVDVLFGPIPYYLVIEGENVSSDIIDSKYDTDARKEEQRKSMGKTKDFVWATVRKVYRGIIEEAKNIITASLQLLSKRMSARRGLFQQQRGILYKETDYGSLGGLEEKNMDFFNEKFSGMKTNYEDRQGESKTYRSPVDNGRPRYTNLENTMISYARRLYDTKGKRVSGMLTEDFGKCLREIERNILDELINRLKKVTETAEAERGKREDEIKKRAKEREKENKGEIKLSKDEIKAKEEKHEYTVLEIKEKEKRYVNLIDSIRNRLMEHFSFYASYMFKHNYGSVKKVSQFAENGGNYVDETSRRTRSSGEQLTAMTKALVEKKGNDFKGNDSMRDYFVKNVESGLDLFRKSYENVFAAVTKEHSSLRSIIYAFFIAKESRWSERFLKQDHEDFIQFHVEYCSLNDKRPDSTSRAIPQTEIKKTFENFEKNMKGLDSQTTSVVGKVVKHITDSDAAKKPPDKSVMSKIDPLARYVSSEEIVRRYELFHYYRKWCSERGTKTRDKEYKYLSYLPDLLGCEKMTHVEKDGKERMVTKKFSEGDEFSSACSFILGELVGKRPVGNSSHDMGDALKKLKEVVDAKTGTVTLSRHVLYWIETHYPREIDSLIDTERATTIIDSLSSSIKDKIDKEKIMSAIDKALKECFFYSENDVAKNKSLGIPYGNGDKFVTTTKEAYDYFDKIPDRQLIGMFGGVFNRDTGNPNYYTDIYSEIQGKFSLMTEVHETLNRETVLAEMKELEDRLSKAMKIAVEHQNYVENFVKKIFSRIDREEWKERPNYENMAKTFKESFKVVEKPDPKNKNPREVTDVDLIALLRNDKIDGDSEVIRCLSEVVLGKIEYASDSFFTSEDADLCNVKFFSGDCRAIHLYYVHRAMKSLEKALLADIKAIKGGFSGSEGDSDTNILKAARLYNTISSRYAEFTAIEKRVLKTSPTTEGSKVKTVEGGKGGVGGGEEEEEEVEEVIARTYDPFDLNLYIWLRNRSIIRKEFSEKVENFVLMTETEQETLENVMTVNLGYDIKGGMFTKFVHIWQTVEKIARYFEELGLIVIPQKGFIRYVKPITVHHLIEKDGKSLNLKMYFAMKIIDELIDNDTGIPDFFEKIQDFGLYSKKYLPESAIFWEQNMVEVLSKAKSKGKEAIESLIEQMNALYSVVEETINSEVEDTEKTERKDMFVEFPENLVEEDEKGHQIEENSGNNAKDRGKEKQMSSKSIYRRLNKYRGQRLYGAKENESGSKDDEDQEMKDDYNDNDEEEEEVDDENTAGEDEIQEEEYKEGEDEEGGEETEQERDNFITVEGSYTYVDTDSKGKKKEKTVKWKYALPKLLVERMDRINVFIKEDPLDTDKLGGFEGLLEILTSIGDFDKKIAKKRREKEKKEESELKKKKSKRLPKKRKKKGGKGGSGGSGGKGKGKAYDLWHFPEPKIIEFKMSTDKQIVEQGYINGQLLVNELDKKFFFIKPIFNQEDQGKLDTTKYSVELMDHYAEAKDLSKNILMKVPREMMRMMYWFQREAFFFQWKTIMMSYTGIRSGTDKDGNPVTENPTLILSMDTGLGKTLVSILFSYCCLKYNPSKFNNNERFCMISPVSLVGNWKSQLKSILGMYILKKEQNGKFDNNDALTKGIQEWFKKEVLVLDTDHIKTFYSERRELTQSSSSTGGGEGSEKKEKEKEKEKGKVKKSERKKYETVVLYDKIIADMLTKKIVLFSNVVVSGRFKQGIEFTLQGKKISLSGIKPGDFLVKEGKLVVNDQKTTSFAQQNQSQLFSIGLTDEAHKVLEHGAKEIDSKTYVTLKNFLTTWTHSRIAMTATPLRTDIDDIFFTFEAMGSRLITHEMVHVKFGQLAGYATDPKNVNTTKFNSEKDDFDKNIKKYIYFVGKETANTGTKNEEVTFWLNSTQAQIDKFNELLKIKDKIKGSKKNAIDAILYHPRLFLVSEDENGKMEIKIKGEGLKRIFDELEKIREEDTEGRAKFFYELIQESAKLKADMEILKKIYGFSIEKIKKNDGEFRYEIVNDYNGNGDNGKWRDEKTIIVSAETVLLSILSKIIEFIFKKIGLKFATKFDESVKDEQKSTRSKKKKKKQQTKTKGKEEIVDITMEEATNKKEEGETKTKQKPKAKAKPRKKKGDNVKLKLEDFASPKHPECKILLITTQSAVGHDLQEASIMIIDDLGNIASEGKQTEGRVDRIGQKRHTRIIKVFNKDSPDLPHFLKTTRRRQIQNFAVGDFDIIKAIEANSKIADTDKGINYIEKIINERKAGVNYDDKIINQINENVKSKGPNENDVEDSMLKSILVDFSKQGAKHTRSDKLLRSELNVVIQVDDDDDEETKKKRKTMSKTSTTRKKNAAQSVKIPLRGSGEEEEEEFDNYESDEDEYLPESEKKKKK